MPSRADLAKIHIAAKELQIDGEQYRFLLWDRFRVSSAKDLAQDQVGELLRHFRKLGWRPKLRIQKTEGRGQKKGKNFITIKPGPAAKQQRYILALWGALGYEVAKLHTRCLKQFGLERFEWVTDYEQLHVIITDLQARCRAAGIDPSVRAK